MKRYILSLAAILALLLFMTATGLGNLTSAAQAADDVTNRYKLANLPGLPPAMGAIEPRVMPKKTEDALWRQDWFVYSFLNLRDDFEEARKQGKRFVVMFEQRGCIYCVKLQKKTLSRKYINDYARKNFAIVQLNMWGDREVTDFDGKTMTEKQLAARWGVIFTPTIVFYKDSLDGLDGKFGPPLEVVRLNLVGPGTVYDMMVWIKHKIYEKERNFQRFHIERINQRRAMRGEKKGTDGKPLKAVKTSG